MRAPSATAAAEVMAHVKAAQAESLTRGFEKPFLAIMYFLGSKFAPMLFNETLTPLFKICQTMEGNEYHRLRSNFIQDYTKLYDAFKPHAHFTAQLTPLPSDKEPTNDPLRLLYLRRGAIWHGLLTFLAEQDPRDIFTPHDWDQKIQMKNNVGRLRNRLGLDKYDADLYPALKHVV
jgi:hypothetical protein